ncbi:MAG: isoaspartyl peptidase/L-asparaginase [Clostridia bacterium]|nr:isoaspartyl peptidase/L-asparaginase [Clostridia bacterium]
MYAIIGTWKMSFDGVSAAARDLASGGSAGDAVQAAIQQVESNPRFRSVGLGGLPARDGQVYLDSGYMDGDSLHCGAVLSATDISSPITCARLLCGRDTNWMLSGESAREFAVSCGIPLRDMRTEESQEAYREAMKTFSPGTPLSAYRGHDTVCVLALDTQGHMVSGTSTSGLFLKEPGRVGDSPIPGSGYYCDTRYGAAAATGLGEDIMRGVLSYEAVRCMREGMTAQKAAEAALEGFVSRKEILDGERGHISLITLSPGGAFGAATTEVCFPFTIATPALTRILYTLPKKDGSMAILDTQPEGTGNTD